MTAPSDVTKILASADALTLVRALAVQIEQGRHSPSPALNFRLALAKATIDLSDAKYTRGDGQLLGEGGFGISYLRRGSHRGGLLTLTIGGKLETFGPGDFIGGAFDDMQILRAPGSAQSGVARLAIHKTPFTDYREAAVDDAQVPVDLVGSVNLQTGVITYVTVTEDTDPAGATPAAMFDPSGWNVIRVLMDGNSAAGNATSWDVVPFSAPEFVSYTWHENGTERIAIPDSDTSGFRYRSFLWGVGGRGPMACAIRNLLAAGRTGVGLCVQGVR